MMPLTSVEINGREETREKVNLRFGEDFAEEGVFTGDIALDLDWVNDEGEGILFHELLPTCVCYDFP